jgi:D-amino-acid oxidase
MKQLLKVLRKGVEEEEPLWIDFMPRGCCRLLPPEEVAKGFEKIYEIAVPLIETPVFLPWLKDHLEKSGVSFIQKEINHLHEIKNDYDIIINCTGLGAGKLCNDKTIIPVRGQVALLSAKEGLPIYLDNEKPLYIVPRKDGIIIGGTYEENVNAEITESGTINSILKNAYAAMPALKKQKLIGSWAGIRPYRKEVRVELDVEGKIIHNYGHGGSGFTLAFGCAKTVLNLVETITR